MNDEKFVLFLASSDLFYFHFHVYSIINHIMGTVDLSLGGRGYKNGIKDILFV